MIIENNVVTGFNSEVGTFISNLNINIAAYILKRRMVDLNALAVFRSYVCLIDDQLDEKNIKDIKSVRQINTIIV